MPSGRSKGSSRLLELVWKQHLPSDSFAAHALALGCIGLAVLAHLLIAAPGFRIAPYASLFPAIVIATIAGGWAAGITALIAGALAAWFLLLPPEGTFVVSTANQLTSLALYGFTGFFLAAVTTLMRRAAERQRVGKTQAHDDHDRSLSALEASGAGTWRWDVQRDSIEWDDALCRLYGIEPEQAPKNAAQFLEIVHPDDRTRARAAIRDGVRNGDVTEYEFRAVVPKGTLRIYDRSRLVRDAAGKPAYMTGACIDITARHAANEERHRIGTWLRTAMEVAQIGTWEYDPKTEIFAGSQSLDAMFGIPRDGKVRKRSEYVEAIHPEDRPRVEQAIAERASTGEAVSTEYRLVRADGSIRWVASRGAFVRGVEGGERMIGSLFDITERKEAEEEREQALRQRELLLRELNHRVKNNLQMVSSLLNLQAARLADPAAREQFKAAVARVHTIGDLHARLYQGDRLGQIEFDEYLTDLCNRLRQSMLDGRRVSLEVETTPLLLDLDRAVPLGLIVNELVTNSIKHAFPDGHSGRIYVRLRPGDADGHVLSVEDTGAGLPGGGNGDARGLGMKVVHGLLQQVGGEMNVVGEAGAHHRITIPRIGPRPETDASASVRRPQ